MIGDRFTIVMAPLGAARQVSVVWTVPPYRMDNKKLIITAGGNVWVSRWWLAAPGQQFVSTRSELDALIEALTNFAAEPPVSPDYGRALGDKSPWDECDAVVQSLRAAWDDACQLDELEEHEVNAGPSSPAGPRGMQ